MEIQFMNQKCCMFLLLVIPALVFAQSPQVSTLLQEGKNLDATAHEEDALLKYLDALKLDPGNYEAAWNSSYLYSRIGNRLADNGKKQQYFNLAKKYAQKALQLDSSDAESNYVMAVAMGRMALISPAKEKVAASRDIKKYSELAIQYNPNHAGAYYVLGKWNYEVANLNFAERTAAKYLFGGVPDGTLDYAIKDYLKAIKLAPDYILYYLDLAIALNEKQLTDETKKVLNQALELKPKTEDDPAYLKQCRELLATLR